MADPRTRNEYTAHFQPLAGCLRVTVGAPAENDAFVTALAASL